MMHFAFVMLASSAQVAPDWPSVARLGPAAAGDIVLARHRHNPIVEVAPRARESLQPPGTLDIDLVEQSRERNGGCVRQRWTAIFRQPPGSEAAPVLEDVTAAFEAALPTRSGCDDAQFARLATGLDPAMASRHCDGWKISGPALSKPYSNAATKQRRGYAVPIKIFARNWPSCPPG